MRRYEFVFICLGLVYFALTVWIQWSGINKEPPFRYSEDIYQPVQPVVCPGDALAADISIELDNVYSLALTATTWWSVDNQYTVIPEYDVAFIIHDGAGEVVRQYEKIVPELPPGRYELRHAAQELNSQPDIFKIPFTVPEGCSD